MFFPRDQALAHSCTKQNKTKQKIDTNSKKNRESNASFFGKKTKNLSITTISRPSTLDVSGALTTLGIAVEFQVLAVVGAKVCLWDETVGLPCLGDSLVHLVDVLEGETLGLVDEGPDEGDTDEAASTPDKEDLGLEVGVAGTLVDHVWGCVADGEVEEPVGGGGHGETFGADLEGEDFTSDDWGMVS